jgi:ABC-type dipeptide/oligopeptide/nickel transport system permease subunit
MGAKSSARPRGVYPNAILMDLVMPGPDGFEGTLAYLGVRGVGLPSWGKVISDALTCFYEFTPPNGPVGQGIHGRAQV